MAKGIKMLSIDELEQMNEKELKAEVARLKARLRSRRSALKKAGLNEYVDAATPQVEKSEFSAEKQRLLAEIKELHAKLNDPLTTIKGAREHLRNKASGLKQYDPENPVDTSGDRGHAHYTAIMDLIPQSARDEARSLDDSEYGSDGVFIIGGYMKSGLSYKEAYNKLLGESLEKERKYQKQYDRP